MEILVISPHIYPAITGGMEIYNYYFIKELQKLGQKVTLLSHYPVKIDIQQYKLYTKNSFLQAIQIFFHYR